MRRFLTAILIAIILTGAIGSGCGPLAPTVLGDCLLSGVLPGGWEDAPLTGNAVARVIKRRVPVPWEVLIYPAPKGAGEPAKKGWVFVKEETLRGPRIRVGNKWENFIRQSWIYRARFSDGRLLEASVDKRFNRRQAERFLSSLRVTK